MKSLIEAGSNVNMKDKSSANTPLHCAILHYYNEAALLLIENGENKLSVIKWLIILYIHRALCHL